MGPSRRLFSSLFMLFTALPAGFCDVNLPLVNPGFMTQSKTLGDCQVCKLFVQSFKIGLERTTRGNYEGGDTAWEEEKLKKSYKRSEMRLIDIHEGICKEESKHSVQCHHIAEKAEEFIEEWWAQDPDESDDLDNYICIEKLAVCCPPLHYGKDCTPCLGDHKKLCSGKGKCRGDGTRKGNGTCKCNAAYAGDDCSQCQIGYYESHKNDEKLCAPCHKACVGCRQGSARDCIACRPGYVFDTDKGCLDVDECNEPNTCSEQEFCMNSIGSHKCFQCHKSCDRCHGDGPDMCRECATNFMKEGEFCVAQIDNARDEQLTTTRYMTYVGLLIATGILLPKSGTLGGLVAAMVLSYMMAAEYYCMLNGHNGLVNLRYYDLSQIFLMTPTDDVYKILPACSRVLAETVPRSQLS